jgi:predicted RNase H-like nuclease (RuvC/YqgF family)
MSGTELITGMEDIVQHIKELEIKNKKLEEENKKLKEENAELSDTCFVLDDIAAERSSHNEALEEERVRLQSQNEKLQEELLYYRFYTYTLDRSGDCDLTKEDVDYFTDDEAQRKTLYERIGYEEEDEDSDDPDEE